MVWATEESEPLPENERNATSASRKTPAGLKPWPGCARLANLVILPAGPIELRRFCYFALGSAPRTGHAFRAVINTGKSTAAARCHEKRIRAAFRTAGVSSLQQVTVYLCILKDGASCAFLRYFKSVNYLPLTFSDSL